MMGIGAKHDKTTKQKKQQKLADPINLQVGVARVEKPPKHQES
jgi:hypothetical protein